MNGSVPEPALVEFVAFADTNTVCPCADAGDDPGDRVADAPLTALLGVHDFDVLAATTQGVDLHDFEPAIPLEVQVVVVHDFEPDIPEDVQFVVVHDFEPDCPVGVQDEVVPGGVLCPDGGVEGVVGDEVQPVWAGFVLAMPWLPSHS